jgi:hypothetical protein
MQLSNTGIYYDTLQAVTGCDSVIELTLYVLSPSLSTAASTICSGDTFYVGNIAHTQAGNYSDTVPNVNGCDSIIELTLTVLSSSFTGIGDGVCENTLYNFNGMLLSDPGLYYDIVFLPLLQHLRKASAQVRLFISVITR